MRRLLLVVLLAVAAQPLSAKSLYWRALDVTAQLDADGRLHVVERQSMVFDGDWNGGERTFRLGSGQHLTFESVSRVVDGVERPLTYGNLDAVDQYALPSPTVLRWRSRLPSDPPFANQEITYVLKYYLSGIVRESDGTYALDHNFVFPDRAGVIENFSLRFDVDPAWTGTKSPIVMQRKGVVPGEGVVISLRLGHSGAHEPNGVVNAPSGKLAAAMFAMFVVALLLLVFDFAMGEKDKGRFARVQSPDTIDEAWLKENLFVLSPEAAGTIFDGKTGAAEVAAMLARMAVEKKIESAVETRKRLLTTRQVLTMKLLVERSELSDAERALVNALFLRAETTDTDKIREHYKDSGFDPAAIVAGGVEGTVQQFAAREKKQNKVWTRDALYIAGAFVLSIVSAIAGGNENNTSVAVTVIFIGVIVGVVAPIVASLNKRAISLLIPRFAAVALILLPLLFVTGIYTREAPDYSVTWLTQLAICAWALAITKLTLDVLRIPQHEDTVAFRKRLASARNYFMHELRADTPRLRDDWYPYLLAFGLGRHVDRWFGAHSDSVATTRSSDFSHTSSSSSSSSSSVSSSPSFTGGGGAFGGAGASGTWAVAAAAIGAGVSAPSSSSDSSGGGGGGSSSSSSSGGGGGGGW